MSNTTRKWVLDTVEKLSHTEIEELKRYLEYLILKTQFPTENLRYLQDSQKPEQKGRPSQILGAINKSQKMTIEDAEALLQSIKEGEIPIRFDSAFDKSTGE